MQPTPLIVVAILYECNILCDFVIDAAYYTIEPSVKRILLNVLGSLKTRIGPDVEMN